MFVFASEPFGCGLDMLLLWRGFVLVVAFVIVAFGAVWWLFCHRFGVLAGLEVG